MLLIGNSAILNYKGLFVDLIEKFNKGSLLNASLMFILDVKVRILCFICNSKFIWKEKLNKIPYKDNTT